MLKQYKKIPPREGGPWGRCRGGGSGTVTVCSTAGADPEPPALFHLDRSCKLGSPNHSSLSPWPPFSFPAQAALNHSAIPADLPAQDQPETHAKSTSSPLRPLLHPPLASSPISSPRVRPAHNRASARTTNVRATPSERQRTTRGPVRLLPCNGQHHLATGLYCNLSGHQ